MAACLSRLTGPDACPGSPAARATRALSPAEALALYRGSASAGGLPSPAGSQISCWAALHGPEGLCIAAQRLCRLSPVSTLTQAAAGLWSVSGRLLPGFVMAGLCPGEAERLVSFGQALLARVVARGLQQLLNP